jgi:hypothetical protein
MEEEMRIYTWKLISKKFLIEKKKYYYGTNTPQAGKKGGCIISKTTNVLSFHDNLLIITRCA